MAEYERKQLSQEEVARLKAGRERARELRERQSEPAITETKMEMLSELDQRLENGRRRANGKFYGVGGRRNRRRRH